MARRELRLRDHLVLRTDTESRSRSEAQVPAEAELCELRSQRPGAGVFLPVPPARHLPRYRRCVDLIVLSRVRMIEHFLRFGIERADEVVHSIAVLKTRDLVRAVKGVVGEVLQGIPGIAKPAFCRDEVLAH